MVIIESYFHLHIYLCQTLTILSYNTFALPTCCRLQEVLEYFSEKFGLFERKMKMCYFICSIYARDVFLMSCENLSMFGSSVLSAAYSA